MNSVIDKPRVQLEWDIAVTKSKINNYRENIETLEYCLSKEENKLRELVLQLYIDSQGINRI